MDDRVFSEDIQTDLWRNGWEFHGIDEDEFGRFESWNKDGSNEMAASVYVYQSKDMMETFGEVTLLKEFLVITGI